jgi:hypothetical protein
MNNDAADITDVLARPFVCRAHAIVFVFESTEPPRGQKQQMPYRVTGRVET